MNEGTRKTSRQQPWDGVNDREPESFGSWLRREREARQVSIDEIADVTKISKSYLVALEENRFDVLPALVFAKGFLREYAKYVGLDGNEVVNSYLTAIQADEPEALGEALQDRRQPLEWTSGLLLVGALVLLLATIGFLGFRAERARSPEPAVEPTAMLEERAPGVAVPAALTPAPAVPAAAPEPPPAEAALAVTIDFTEDCWVEVTVDGRRGLSELHVQGESLRLEADRRVELTLGNPRGVQIEVNGEPFSLAGYRPDRVARDIVIEAEETNEL